MKNFIIFLALAIFLNSCVAISSLPSLRENADASEKDKGDFVELKDGTIVEGKKVVDRFVIILSKIGSGYLSLDEKKYSFKEINAFQSKGKYYRKDVYNKFDERIINGRINGYKKEMSGENHKGGSFGYNLYFIQKGEKGPVITCETKKLKKMIQDYSPAADAFKSYEGLSKREKRKKGDYLINEIIAIYNNQGK